MTEELRVEAVRVTTETDTYVADLVVTPDGSFVLDAQDVGQRARQFWGDSDYEYWITVEAADVPQLLIALVRDRFGDDITMSAAYRAWLGEHEIPYRFDSYV